MKEAQTLRQAHEQALAILHNCCTDAGFRASADSAGYPQIWARDSAIMALGAVVTGDGQLHSTIKASLQTLAEFQSRKGLIPLNVNPDNGYISTENAGAVDANLWFVITHFLYWQVTADNDFLAQSWSVISKALSWLEYQDMNDCGLLETPEAGNWMDLISIRYNTLYDNSLYYAAHLAYHELHRQLPAGTPLLETNVTTVDVHERINLLMWVDRCWVPEHFATHLERLKEIRLEWFMLYHNIGTISSRPYYLPWVAFREYGDWCDTLGNCLAILTGIADGHRREHILRYFHQVGIADPYPSKAIHPPIYPGENDWRQYFRSRNLNLPHQYHNGGIWPMVGGFHIAALVAHDWQDAAEQLLLNLAKGNGQGLDRPWGFNEWFHGKTGRPMGFDQQGWSASMYLYAEHAVTTGKLPLFDALIRSKPPEAQAAENNDFTIRAGGGPTI